METLQEPPKWFQTCCNREEKHCWTEKQLLKRLGVYTAICKKCKCRLIWWQSIVMLHLLGKKRGYPIVNILLVGPKGKVKSCSLWDKYLEDVDEVVRKTLKATRRKRYKQSGGTIA